MKGYVSILKGAKLLKKIHKKNFKSLFILNNELKPRKPEFNGDTLDTLPNINYLSNNIRKTIKEPQKVIKLFRRTSRMSKIREDYEDLFFHFLKISNAIYEFEIFSEKINNNFNCENYNNKTEIDKFEDEYEIGYKNENENNNKIDIETIFYSSIFLGLTEKNKILWSSMFFYPKSIYKIIYRKSRTKQKEILDYCLKYKINYDAVINSYEKIYTSKLKIHNYSLTPKEAYFNYLEIFNKKDEFLEKKEIENKIEILNQSYYYENRDNIVLKTNNKGKGKMLIYDGTKINIYIDDYLKNNKLNDNDNIESTFSDIINNKEIFYQSKDFLPKIKHSFSSGKKLSKGIQNNNNKIIFNGIKNFKIKTINKTEANEKNKKNNKKMNLKSYLFNLFKNNDLNKKINNNDKLYDKYKFSISPEFPDFDENSIMKKNLITKQKNKNKTKRKINLFNMFNKFNSDFYY